MDGRISRFSIFVIAAVLLCCAFYIFAAYVIYQYGSLSRDLGWRYKFEGSRCIVTAVSPTGPAAGKLRRGDEILTINGSSRFGGLSMYRMYIGRIIYIPPHGSYEATVSRDSQTLHLSLKANITKDHSQFVRIVTLVSLTVVCLVVGAIVGLSKGQTEVGKWFAVIWLLMPFLLGTEAMLPLKEFLTASEVKLYYLAVLLSFAPIQVAAGYRFYYLFPVKKQSLIWDSIQWILFLINGFLIALLTVIRLTAAIDERAAVNIFLNHPWILSSFRILGVPPLIFGFLAMVAVAIRNFMLVEAPDQKRRIRWTLYGTILGLLPSAFAFLLIFVSRATSWEIANNQSIRQINFIGQISLVLIPISVGYAVAKHRLFDINLVVRRSLHYLLAKNVLRILIYLPVILIVYAIRVNPNRSIGQILFSNSEYLIIFVLALIGLASRKALMVWLDRKYFREAYNSERILLGLVEDVKKADSLSHVTRLLSSQLDSALHPTRILVFYRSAPRADLALDYSSGGFHSQDLRIPANFQFVRHMEMEGKAQNSDAFFTDGIPEEERQWLQELEIAMVVPINTPDQRLVGLLLLGEKKSEQPYSATDRKMLEALVGQIAMLYENWQLKERVIADQRIQRDVLAHLTKEKRNLLKECPTCGSCYESPTETCQLDGSELILTLPVERTIDEKYRLEKLLGRGGMGAVYEATDLRLLRKVAIKIIMGRMFGDQSALRRFEREARASARLSHPNITTVYDFGTIGEGAYLVMELLAGSSLRDELKKRLNLSSGIAAEWFNQIFEGMKYAHRMGVIHRDLKPENILITAVEEGKQLLKILDFGLAKIQMVDSAESKSLTSPGMALGTLSYMSPEQLIGEKVDERSDIFSLGVMVVEGLTGTKPFSGENQREVAIAILQKQFAVQGDDPEITRLNAILQKCIAKKREDRFSTVEEMQRELIPAIRQCPHFVTHPLPAGDDRDGTTLWIEVHSRND